MTLKKVLERELRDIQRNRTEAKRPESINDVFDRCSPHLDHPDHLGPYVEQLELAVRTGGLESCFHAPPQHGKTESAKHALIYFDFERPGMRHAYTTYSGDRAKKVKKQVMKLAFEAGRDPHSAGPSISLGSGTEIQFVGRGGGLTGEPIDGILICDDLLKDRKEASSQTIRQDCWDWFTDVAETRCHPGSSKLIMNTRWSTDDIIGRVIANYGWRYTRLAAECDSDDDPLGRAIGEALWPARRPSKWLQKFKRSPMTWASMYQGRPRPLGDALFQDACFYDQLPSAKGYRVAHGTDLAYTAKTRADWSVLLSGRAYGDDLYLTDCLRMQVQADVFTARMAARVRANPGPVLWYGNTVERGTAQLIRQTIPSFMFRLATSDKYVRALPTAEQLWNPGRVLVPSRAEWADGFVQRVSDFTGEDGGEDDEIDALAALGDLKLEMGRRMGAHELTERMRGKMRGHLRVCG